MKKNYFVLLFFAVSAFVFSQKKILVIQSYSLEYNWDRNYTQALKNTISSEADLFFFEMNTKNLPMEEQVLMADKAYNKFLEVKPDIVVLGDDAALKMLGPKIVPHKTPMIFLGINNNPRYYFNKYPSNITGILERPHLKRNLIFFKEFMPKAKKVLILFDDDITSKIVKKEYFSNKKSLMLEGLNIDIFLVGRIWF